MPNDLETAFVVGKRKDGSFFATVDLSNELKRERKMLMCIKEPNIVDLYVDVDFKKA